MDILVKGRGAPLTDHVRRVATEKLSRLERKNPRVLRAEVEILAERNPRLNGSKRLQGTVQTPSHAFHAKATGPDLEVALDELVERLERQIHDYYERKRARKAPERGRVQSPAPGQEEPGQET